MARIHPLAVVDPAARIADDVEIGPFCTIGPHAEIAVGCRLIAQVHVEGRTSIGSRTTVYPNAALGTPPQSAGYRGEPTALTIGADCLIREGVTMNIGTADGGGITTVGDRGFFMTGAHVGHDCHVGSDVVFANAATLGGHCEIGDHVFIGGLSAVHQHTRVGAHAMIGGITGVRADVIPFGLANDSRARLYGINVIGMRRRKFTNAAIAAVRHAYRQLFLAAGSLEQRLHTVESELGGEAAVAQIIAFVRARGKRSLTRPGRSSEA
jgi:UDP-N-acetylglucosamine acyltransferase